MSTWGQKDLRTHMQVFSADEQNLGHIAQVYEDSFLIHKGLIFPKDRYIPYNAIASISENTVKLVISAEEAKLKEWEKRPDYEDHPGDPTQLLYDRGHGIADPFEGDDPSKA